MFNIEREIGKWRKEMLKKRWISCKTLRELEEHLRDEIDAQKGNGLNSVNAFDVAVNQIGKAERLSIEFQKVHNAQYWINRFGILLLVTILYFGYNHLQNQEIVVNARFVSLDVLNDRNEFSARDASGALIELLPNPSVNLKLKEETPGKKLYFDLWIHNSVFHGVCYRTSLNDVIFIDVNNDLDPTNDGLPIIFPHTENSISAEITSSFENIISFQLFRKPTFMADSFLRESIRDNGQLRPSFVNFIKMNPQFKGNNNTYFFMRKVNVIRGSAKFPDHSLDVAICDVDLNGRYDDAVDRLLVDTNGDGKLHLFNPEEMFNLTDDIQIDNKHYRLNKLTLSAPAFSFVDSNPGKGVAKSILWSSK